MKKSIVRILIGLVSMVLLVLMVSCQRGHQTSQRSRKSYVVGVTLLTKSHPFYQELEAAMRETAK
ncbi:MAG: hypothetical protein ACPL7O_13725, partial [Armatimonadota bacterium]